LGLSRLYLNRNLNLNSNRNDLANSKFIKNKRAFEWPYDPTKLGFKMKTHKNLYNNLISEENLFLAWKKARKDKTDRWYVKLFERNLINNLNKLQKELENQTYSPQPLKMFILRDPKTRKVGKSNFRDRVVHHAIVNIIEPIFDKTFIHDSYANRKDKGTLAAVKRFDKFKRKVSKNGSIIRNNFKDNNYVKGYCLKADIKHYFDTIDHEVLIKIIKKKINDNKLKAKECHWET